jgi:hypothetical protein
MCYETHVILKYNKIHNLMLINMDISIGIIMPVFFVTNGIIMLVFTVTMWNINIYSIYIYIVVCVCD